MNVLGIWDGHDSGAALLQEGRLRFAVNEERLSRRKLEVRFPTQSIDACLADAGLDPKQISIVAASTSDPAKTLSGSASLAVTANVTKNPPPAPEPKTSDDVMPAPSPAHSALCG